MKRLISWILVITMVLSLVPAYAFAAEETLSSKLLAEYNFDDQTTNDSAGSNHATFYDNATATTAGYVDGVSGKALQLSTQGTEEKYWLSVPYSAFGTNTDSFTVSLWYNATGHNTEGENSELLSLYNSSSEKFLFYGAPYSGSNAFTMKWDSTYGYANVIGGYKENEWVHLVFAVDAVDGQSKITAYVNGVAVEVDQGGEWADSLMSTLGINTFTIGGKNPYKGGTTPNCLFYGSVDEVRLYAGALTADEAKAIYNEVIPEESEEDALKILAIGNSFSVDSTTYLWNILNAGGYTNAIVGNAQIGGTHLDDHWANIQSGEAKYYYHKYTANGTQNTTVSYLSALQDEDWDVIVFQQGGSTSGVADTFGNLENILAFVDENKTNPDAKLMWNMTWAYPENSSESSFSLFDNDQLTMYNTVVATTQQVVATNTHIDGIIPAGTAIQNLRTSYLGDTLCRDTIHLSYDYGRYTAAMMWFAYITGGDVSQIDWVPTNYGYVANDLPAIREAVTDALATPYAVSQCDAARVGDAVQAGDLIGQWNFDDSNTQDSVGNYHATLYNNATAASGTYVEGVSGNALKLSTQGTDEKYWLDIPYSVFGNYRDSFTISLWYNATGHNTEGENSELFSLYNRAGEKFLFYAAPYSDSSNGFTMKWAGTGTYGYANVIGGYKENEWVHLVFAVDAVDGQSKITAYVNGVAVEVDQGGEWADSLMSQLGVNRFTIGGKNPYKGGTTPNCLFYGAVDEVRLYAGALTADEAKAIYNEIIPEESEEDALKILAIGNSYSMDATSYLWEIMNDGGITNHTVAMAYIPGSSLDTHWGNIEDGSAAYAYWKNTSGQWSYTTGKTLLEILTAEKWDIITIQQQSLQAGQGDYFTNLENILDFIYDNKTNADAKVYWHMTWAYPSDNVADENFQTWYNRDQLTMYNAIVTQAQEKMESNARIAGIIPAGTAIQNLRTSYLGDSLCRDTVHLDYDQGRYTAAMLWYAYLTGGDVAQIDWTPASRDFIANDLPAIREAVNDALAASYAVSQCDAARVGDAVQSGDLIGQWSFDDNTTNDSVGNYHAILYNNATEAAGNYVEGVSGNALKLSTQGTDEKYWLEIPHSVFGDYEDSFTISMWYNATGHNTEGENSELFSLYNNCTDKFLFYAAPYTDSSNGFTMKWAGTGTYGYANVIGGYKENEWVHLVFAVDAVDGQSVITAYVNGVAVEVDQGGEWADSLMSQLGINTFTIGGKNPYKGGTTPNCLFYGSVDEVQLYAGAMSAEKAAEIYNAIANPPAERGDLLAEYNFDDETTNDAVGINHATFYNNATATAAGYVDGVSGKALQLSTQGTDEKYWLSVPYSAFGGNTDSFTISLWYNAAGHNASGENSELFSLYNSSSEKFLFYAAPYSGSNAFTMKWAGAGTYGYANVIGGYKENEWVHLVFAVDAVDGQSVITAYINGAAVEVDQGGEWANSLMSQLGINTFTIGGKNPYKGGSTPNCLFYGSVDEVQMYAGALTAEEAANIYKDQLPPPERGTLLAQYSFDDETTNDSVGSNDASFHNDTAAAIATYADGISGKALQLSTKGTDEKYWLGIPYSAFSGSTDSFTLSIWYNSSDYNTEGEDSELFTLYNSSAEKFLFYSPAAVSFQDMGFTMKWDGSYGYANVMTAHQANAWKHLVFAVDAVDGQSVITAYVNGVEVAVDQGGDWTNSLMSAMGIDTFTIGGKNPYKGGVSPKCQFYGLVDEIELYAGALTAEEARAIFSKAAGMETEPADGMGQVEQLQVALGDDISMDLYTVLTSEMIADAGAYAKITVAGDEKTVLVTDAVTEIVDNKTYFIFTANVAAAQMTEEISLQLFNGAGEGGDIYTCTVRDYALDILASQDYASSHEIVKQMLNYGAKAQTYFGVNTDALANAGYEIETENAVPTDIPAVTVSGTVSGIEYYGATLVFENKVAVRYYFTAPEGVEGYTFTVGGQTYTANAKDGRYYVEIPGINPQAMDQAVNITVSDADGNSLTVDYSPLHYIVRMYNSSSSASLQALLEALYNYHLAAKAFAG